MNRVPTKFAALLGCILALSPHANTAEPASPPDLSEFRTVATAKRAELQPPRNSNPGTTGFLGVELKPDAQGRLSVSSVAGGSPAAEAGIRTGDQLASLDNAQLRATAEVRDRLQQHSPGDLVALAVQRGKERLDLKVTLGAVSRPFNTSDQRAILGVQVTPLEDAEGVKVTRVTTGLPADKAGVKTDDVFLKLDGVALSAGANLGDLLSSRSPGQEVSITYRRGDEEKEFKARLAAEESNETNTTFSRRSLWKKNSYRLAVIPVAFEDKASTESIPLSAWDDMFFSANTYRDTTNCTGQRVYGSVRDYYQEVSCGQFIVTGKVFDWIKADKKRGDYSTGTANTRTREVFFREILDKLLARDGANSIKNFDGLAIIYAGERPVTANRGTLFWPHRGNTTYKGKRLSYIICPEGGSRMANISVFCHEFGHILGLPDLYARPENPGSEGLGTWCVMSNQSGGGRPQHFSAWCKEQLGWLAPVPIDPSVPQKLVLRPIEGATNECFKVLVRPDGSEYLLLENRRKEGFDRSLSGEGLLIWRVTGNRLMLEESHGVQGPVGPRVFLSSVPYPSQANNAFTPYTTPSSRSQLGGGTPVYLTSIQRLADGRVTFEIGYEYQ